MKSLFSTRRSTGVLACGVLAISLGSATRAMADVSLLLSLEPTDKQSTSSISRQNVETSLGSALKQKTSVTKSEDLAEAMRSTRSGGYDVFIASAQIAASALSHGYELLGATGKPEKYALIGRKNIASIGALKGNRLYLPQQDSIYTYMARGMLNASGLSATVLEHDADQVDAVRRFGWQVFYGDATRLDLLRTAGAAQAKVLVLAIDDVAQSLAVAALVREHFPQLTVVARARNVTHYSELRKLGVTLIERELLDSSLMAGRRVLEQLGWQPHAARNQALRFRQHTIDLLDQMAPHLGDEQKLIAVSKQGRQQLESMWAQERDQQAERRNRRGWHVDDTGEASDENRN